MPTYEYRCPSGHQFDLFQSISAEPRAECSSCGQPSERLLSGGAGFIFKGEGFYITDHRSEEYKKAAASEAGVSGEESGASKKGASSGSEASGGSASDGAASSSEASGSKDAAD